MKERTKRVFIRMLTVNTSLTFEDLSKEFQISERTLRNELSTINDYLAINNYPIISTKRGKGLVVPLSERQRGFILTKVGTDNSNDYLRPNDRFIFLLFEIADTSKMTVLYELEEKLLISKSTLDEDMRKLRQFLKNYSIAANSINKQGIQLLGDERTIRTMLFEVINSMTDVDQLIRNKGNDGEVSFVDNKILEYLDTEKLRVVETLYDDIANSLNIPVNHVYRNQIILFLNIWLRRLTEGKTISAISNIKELNRKEHVFILVDAICREFLLQPSFNEMKYITFSIESFNPQDMNNSIDWGTAQLLAIRLIEHVEAKTGIRFILDEEDLYEGLYKHISGLLTRTKNNIQVFNPLKNNIKDSYFEIFQAVKGFTKQIEYYTKSPVSDDEIAFLTIYFSTSKSRMKQEEQLVFQAVVLCNHGVSTGKLLAANLTEQFNIQIIAVLSSYELSFIEKLDVDLIFTTIPIEYPSKPILLLNPILREIDKKEIDAFLFNNKEKGRILPSKLDATELLKDFLSLIIDSGGLLSRDLYQKVERIFNQHQLKFNKRELQPMLQDILHDHHILLEQDCKNWKETIERVGYLLVKDQVVEERYIDAMIKSVEEYGPYIVVGKHLALAHARPEDGVNKLGISVMTLKNPVPFGNIDNDPVKIIFCLAAVDSYSHLNVMKNLIELINDEAKLEELILTNEVKDFHEILQRRE